MNATTGEENFKKVKDTFLFRTQTPKVKMCNNIKIPIENVSVKDDSMKAPTEKDVNIDQNKIIPGFFSENDSLFDDLSNSNEIVKNYNDYLNWLNKKFDKFFLCYNKEQFKAVMAEKGIKVQESREAPRAKQPINNDRLLERRNTKKRRTRRFEGPGNNNNKINVDAGKKENYKTEDNELEFDEDDLPPKPKMEENEFSRLRKKDNKPSNDIFLRFLEEQENKTHEYIHERELRIKKK
jgi:hypothetical protein